MSKKVAVIAVNPINGSGLFQYLEAFFENGISYKTFAVSDTTHIKTNSGIPIVVDDTISSLKGHEDEYDALVFACGDAIPQFSENADKPFNQDMLAVIKSFDEKGKLLIGHCGAGLFFDKLGIGKGKKIALHPYVKPAVENAIATDEKAVVEGNLYTAQTEDSISSLLPSVLEALK